MKQMKTIGEASEGPKEEMLEEAIAAPEVEKKKERRGRPSKEEQLRRKVAHIMSL